MIRNWSSLISSHSFLHYFLSLKDLNISISLLPSQQVINLNLFFIFSNLSRKKLWIRFFQQSNRAVITLFKLLILGLNYLKVNLKISYFTTYLLFFKVNVGFTFMFHTVQKVRFNYYLIQFYKNEFIKLYLSTYSRTLLMLNPLINQNDVIRTLELINIVKYYTSWSLNWSYFGLIYFNYFKPFIFVKNARYFLKYFRNKSQAHPLNNLVVKLPIYWFDYFIREYLLSLYTIIIYTIINFL